MVLRALSVVTPILSALVIALVVAVPALAAAGMFFGRAVVVLGVGVAGFAVLAPRGSRGVVPLAVSAAVSGLVAESMLRVLLRPLSISIAEALIPLVVIAFASAWWIAARPSSRARTGVFVATSVSAGVLTASGFAAGTDFLGTALWSAAAAGVGSCIGLILLCLTSQDRLPGKEVLVIPAIALGALSAATLREFAWLSVDSLLTPEREAALLWPGLAGAGIALASAGVYAACSLGAPRGVLRPIAVLPLLVGVLAASLGSTVVLAQPKEGNGGRMIVATPSDFALAQGMLGQVGAGPRDEFRGMGFYDCDAINSRDCFITYYDDLALRKGVAAAVADVIQKTKDDKGVTFPAHCHQVVHNLGQLAFEIATDFEDAADIDPQVCGTGYTHGLWEQQFTALGDEVMFTRTPTLCTELNMVTPWYNWTCSHIMGHMMVTRMMGNPAVAVDYCNRIKDTQSITDCQAGGWMNFFQDDIVIAKLDKEGSLKDLFSVCYGASTDVKFFCYQELFPAIYPLVGGNDYLAAQACLQYSEKSAFEKNPLPSQDPWGWDISYADRCVQGLARGVLVSSFDDYRRAGPRCMSMPEEARNPCLASTAASVVLNTGSTAAAFPLCRLVSEQKYRTYCYFWAKHSRQLLENGPNSFNLPGRDEIRLPEEGRLPGEPVTPDFALPVPQPSAAQPKPN